MPVNFFYRTLFLLLLSPLTLAVEENDIDALSEQDYFIDLSKIVSATRLPQRAEELPVSITIIDRKMIEASSAIEIVDLFRLVPGMRVAHANGNLFTVVYHGYASAFSNRMQVLIDGRSVFTPLFSIVDWNNLGLVINDIERIEVIRGANSAAYGANAVRGTINIITRKPFQVEGQTLVLTGGSINTGNSSYRYAGVTEDYEYRLTLSTRHDDGFDNVDDHKNIKALVYRGIYTTSRQDVVDIQVGLSGGPLGSWGIPGSWESPVRTKTTRAHFQSLQWSRSLNNNRQQLWSLNNNFIAWDDSYTIDLSLLGFPAGDTATYSLFAGNASRTELEFQQTHDSIDGLRFVWGGSHKVDRLKNSIILNRPDYISVDSQRLFTNIEKRLTEDTLLNAGLMVENNGLVGVYASPRLALNHTISPYHTVRISATQAKRTPSLYEFYNDNTARRDSDGLAIDIRYKSDPNLTEETLTAYELGYLGHYMDNQLAVDVKVYYEKFEDLIRNVTDENTYTDLLGSDTFIWMNTGYTISKGVELQLKFTANNGFSADFQYAYARIKGAILAKTNPDLLYGAEEIKARMPQHSYSLLLSKRLSRQWRGSAGYYYTAAMNWLGGGALDAVDRTDIKLSRSFDTESFSGKVSFVVQNIQNDYFEFENPNPNDAIENVFKTRAYIQFEVDFQ